MRCNHRCHQCKAKSRWSNVVIKETDRSKFTKKLIEIVSSSKKSKRFIYTSVFSFLLLRYDKVGLLGLWTCCQGSEKDPDRKRWFDWLLPSNKRSDPQPSEAAIWRKDLEKFVLSHPKIEGVVMRPGFVYGSWGGNIFSTSKKYKITPAPFASSHSP